MKLIAKLVLVFILLTPLAIVMVLCSIPEDTPILSAKADMTPERIARAKQILENNDPRRFRPGTVAKVVLIQADLDLAINYFANQYLQAIAGLTLDQQRATLSGTLKLPDNPLGKYLNISIELKQSQGLPVIDQVKLGKIPLPTALAEYVLQKSVSMAEPVGIDWQAIMAMIKQVNFYPQMLTVSYRWQDDLPGKLSAALLPEEDQQRVKIYQQRLADLSINRLKPINLRELINPLFQLAGQRSLQDNAIAENRALILVLSLYVNQKSLEKILPQAKAWKHPVWQTVHLNARDDFPKHYLISAMLAAYAGTPLADAVGLFKEIDDAKVGSGFSFNDIAADKAGTRLGELATLNESTAKRIQSVMANAKQSDFMPETADLPEYMADAEFKRRFGGVNAKPYQQMLAKIEQRVADLAINHP